MNGQKIIVFYHGDCPDGFGGAYAAWKKFGLTGQGDGAEYIGLKHGKPFTEDVSGATVYFIDFSYPKEAMQAIAANAASFTILDHHEGVKADVEAMPDHIFDANRSGASIAWTYFHPEDALPELLTYVEDDDLFRFSLPDTRPVLTYLTAHPFSFTAWDAIAKALAGDASRKELLAVARAYAEYFELLAQVSVEQAKLVEFEGHTTYFANAHPLKPLKSLVGNLLAQKMGPFALVVSAHPDGVGVSIRGDGSIDVAKIAKKYGGNGHPNSAGFKIDWDAEKPWKIVEKRDKEA